MFSLLAVPSCCRPLGLSVVPWHLSLRVDELRYIHVLTHAAEAELNVI